MTPTSTFSVIIPNYNYGRFLGEAIKSVLAQTYPALEIIVVDDGSTDDSVKVVEFFGDAVKLIRQKNGGVGKARNTGAANATGEFLAFLDADDIWLPEKLAKQMALFTENVGYASCSMREFNNTGETISNYMSLEGFWTPEDILLFSTPIVISGSAFIVKREVFEQIKGFDEDPNLHPSEDWDFARRVSEVSLIRSTSEILVNYRNHSNNGHLQIRRYERSILLAVERAFSDNSEKRQRIKKRSYGNLYKILAGSYFQVKNYRSFIKNSIKSLWKAPNNIFYFLEFPLRLLKRKLHSSRN